MPRSMQQGHQQQQEDIAPPGEFTVLLNSVADPHHGDADADPDPTFILMRIRILASKKRLKNLERNAQIGYSFSIHFGLSSEN
jgi:hypothetical protein